MARGASRGASAFGRDDHNWLYSPAACGVINSDPRLPLRLPCSSLAHLPTHPARRLHWRHYWPRLQEPSHATASPIRSIETTTRSSCAASTLTSSSPGSRATCQSTSKRRAVLLEAMPRRCVFYVQCAVLGILCVFLDAGAVADRTPPVVAPSSSCIPLIPVPAPPFRPPSIHVCRCALCARVAIVFILDAFIFN